MQRTGCHFDLGGNCIGGGRDRLRSIPVRRQVDTGRKYQLNLCGELLTESKNHKSRRKKAENQEKPSPVYNTLEWVRETKEEGWRNRSAEIVKREMAFMIEVLSMLFCRNHVNQCPTTRTRDGGIQALTLLTLLSIGRLGRSQEDKITGESSASSS